MIVSMVFKVGQYMDEEDLRGLCTSYPKVFSHSRETIMQFFSTPNYYEKKDLLQRRVE